MDEPNFVRRNLKRRYKGLKFSKQQIKRTRRRDIDGPSDIPDVKLPRQEFSGNSKTTQPQPTIDITDPLMRSLDWLGKQESDKSKKGTKRPIMSSNHSTSISTMRGLNVIQGKVVSKMATLEDALQDSRLLTTAMISLVEEHAPKCFGHQAIAAVRTVSKAGLNRGRRFYCCTMPADSRCDFFLWVEDHVELLQYTQTESEDNNSAVDRLLDIYRVRLQTLSRDELVREARAFMRRSQAALAQAESHERDHHSKHHHRTASKSSKTLLACSRIKTSGSVADLRLRLVQEARGWLQRECPVSLGELHRALELESPHTSRTHTEIDARTNAGTNRHVGVISSDGKSDEAEEAEEEEEVMIELSDSDDDLEVDASEPLQPVPRAVTPSSSVPKNSKDNSDTGNEIDRSKSAAKSSSLESESSSKDFSRDLIDTDEEENEDVDSEEMDEGNDESSEEDYKTSRRKSLNRSCRDKKTLKATKNSGKKVASVAFSGRTSSARSTATRLLKEKDEEDDDGDEEEDASEQDDLDDHDSAPDSDDNSDNEDDNDSSLHTPSSLLESLLQRCLAHYFGLSRLRAGQLQVLSRLLRNRNTLALLPTGQGKSLLYQLPALLGLLSAPPHALPLRANTASATTSTTTSFPESGLSRISGPKEWDSGVLGLQGLTIVISPLIALMHDQLQHLPLELQTRAYAFTSAHTSSTQSTCSLCRRLLRGEIRLLYVSPERFVSTSFQSLLTRLQRSTSSNATYAGGVQGGVRGRGSGRGCVSLVCVDEAHCLSQWALQFRPAFLRIRSLLHRRSPFRHCCVLALTATAGPRVTRDICTALRIRCHRDRLHNAPPSPPSMRRAPANDVLETTTANTINSSALVIGSASTVVSATEAESEGEDDVVRVPSQRHRLALRSLYLDADPLSTTSHHHGNHHSNHHSTYAFSQTTTFRGAVQTGSREELVLQVLQSLFDTSSAPNSQHNTFQRPTASSPTSVGATARGVAIVYVARRSQSEALCTYLQAHGLGCAFYHAGMENEARKAVQRQFDRGLLQVVVATVAFGLGVDKADVR